MARERAGAAQGADTASRGLARTALLNALAAGETLEIAPGRKYIIFVDLAAMDVDAMDAYSSVLQELDPRGALVILCVSVPTGKSIHEVVSAIEVKYGE